MPHRGLGALCSMALVRLHRTEVQVVDESHASGNPGKIWPDIKASERRRRSAIACACRDEQMPAGMPAAAAPPASPIRVGGQRRQ